MDPTQPQSSTLDFEDVLDVKFDADTFCDMALDFRVRFAALDAREVALRRREEDLDNRERALAARERGDTAAPSIVSPGGLTDFLTRGALPSPATAVTASQSGNVNTPTLTSITGTTHAPSDVDNTSNIFQDPQGRLGFKNPSKDRVYIYVGAPVREKATDEDRSEELESRERLQELGLAELRRRANQISSSTSTSIPGIDIPEGSIHLGPGRAPQSIKPTPSINTSGVNQPATHPQPSETGRILSKLSDAYATGDDAARVEATRQLYLRGQQIGEADLRRESEAWSSSRGAAAARGAQLESMARGIDANIDEDGGSEEDSEDIELGKAAGDGLGAEETQEGKVEVVETSCVENLSEQATGTGNSTVNQLVKNIRALLAENDSSDSEQERSLQRE